MFPIKHASCALRMQARSCDVCVVDDELPTGCVCVFVYALKYSTCDVTVHQLHCMLISPAHHISMSTLRTVRHILTENHCPLSHCGLEMDSALFYVPSRRVRLRSPCCIFARTSIQLRQISTDSNSTELDNMIRKRHCTTKETRLQFGFDRLCGTYTQMCLSIC